MGLLFDELHSVFGGLAKEETRPDESPDAATATVRAAMRELLKPPAPIDPRVTEAFENLTIEGAYKA